MNDSQPEDLLYIWLESNPDSSEADTTVEDTPGVSDLDLITSAIIAGHLGRFLPTTIRFATHAEPNPDKVRSIDTARLLRDRSIPHRRRYEIVGDINRNAPDA
jgi:hypothetical protein